MAPRVPEALRARVEEADNRSCRYCRTTEANSGIRMTCDHITPVSKGGADTFENVCLACSACNRFKGDAVDAVDPLTGERVAGRGGGGLDRAPRSGCSTGPPEDLPLMQSAPFQFFSPEYQANPFPFYARMREEGLSRIEPGGFLAVSRHADVVAALRNPAVFSSTGFVQAFEPPWLGDNPGAHTMLSMDPPEHTKLRNLVSRAFVQPVVDRSAPSVQRLVDAVVARFAERGEAEIVADVATPVTAGTLGHFLTLDPALHAKFKAWSDALASVTPEPMGPDHRTVVRAAIDEMVRYVQSVIEERRRAPGDDMVSMLVQAEVDGHRLGDRDLVAFLFLLIVAGLETTVHLLSKSMITLTDRPDLVDRLRADASLVPRFVDEMLRFDPPTHSLFRFVMKDTEVAGKPVPAGSVVMLMLAAANRDERQFARPDVFDLDRDAQGSAAFGHGAHFCIGMALAKLEARLTLESLLRRFRAFERVEPTIAYNHTFTVRGPFRLPVRGLI